ncbi:MAG: hypothetical protein ABSF34_15325, partial [Verrucomicrobiota bacterium]
MQTRIEQQQARQQALFDATNQVAIAAREAQATNSSAAQPVYTAATTTAEAIPAFDTNLPEQIIVLTNATARYTFTSRGGGLKQVELLGYPETISARWRKQDENPSNGVATLNAHVSVPVLAVLGDPGLVGDGNFTLTRTGDGVRAEKDLPDGLVLTKEFQLSSNYLVNASVNLKNDSGKTLVLPAQEFVVGTAAPMDVDDSGFPMYGGATWSDGNTYADTSLGYFNTNTST